ncbi:MAG: response regulator [Fibrobacter sp.]|nr:response regulator [Fibrobacter sp.]
MTTNRYRILVVDDDTKTLQKINQALTSSGKFETHGINHGEAAFDHLETSPRLPDLIVLDMDMPLMSGLEFLAGLKMDARWGDIPVIIMARESSENIEQGLRMGAVDWICKDSINQQLAIRVSHNIREHKAHKKAIEKILKEKELNNSLIASISEEILAYTKDIKKYWEEFYQKTQNNNKLFSESMYEEMPMLLQLLQNDMGRLQRILEEI